MTKRTGPEIAREYEAAVQRLETTDKTVDRFSELRRLTGLWDLEKKRVLQQYVDLANTRNVLTLTQCMVFDEDWLALSQGRNAWLLNIGSLKTSQIDVGLWRKVELKLQTMSKIQAMTQPQQKSKLRTMLGMQVAPRICKAIVLAILMQPQLRSIHLRQPICPMSKKLTGRLETTVKNRSRSLSTSL